MIKSYDATKSSVIARQLQLEIEELEDKVIEKQKQLKEVYSSNCFKKSPELMCEGCNCWKITRAYCG